MGLARPGFLALLALADLPLDDLAAALPRGLPGLRGAALLVAQPQERLLPPAVAGAQRRADGSAPARSAEQAEAVRLFGWLAEEEAAAGTPVETLLGRLPPGMAQEIRRDLAALLAAEDQPPRS